MHGTEENLVEFELLDTTREREGKSNRERKDGVTACHFSEKRECKRALDENPCGEGAEHENADVFEGFFAAETRVVAVGVAVGNVVVAREVAGEAGALKGVVFLLREKTAAHAERALAVGFFRQKKHGLKNEQAGCLFKGKVPQEEDYFRGLANVCGRRSVRRLVVL